MSKNIKLYEYKDGDSENRVELQKNLLLNRESAKKQLNHAEDNLKYIIQLSSGIVKGNNPNELIKNNKEFIPVCVEIIHKLIDIVKILNRKKIYKKDISLKIVKDKIDKSLQSWLEENALSYTCALVYGYEQEISSLEPEKLLNAAQKILKILKDFLINQVQILEVIDQQIKVENHLLERDRQILEFGKSKLDSKPNLDLLTLPRKDNIRLLSVAENQPVTVLAAVKRKSESDPFELAHTPKKQVLNFSESPHSVETAPFLIRSNVYTPNVEAKTPAQLLINRANTASTPLAFSEGFLQALAKGKLRSSQFSPLEEKPTKPADIEMKYSLSIPPTVNHDTLKVTAVSPVLVVPSTPTEENKDEKADAIDVNFAAGFSILPNVTVLNIGTRVHLPISSTSFELSNAKKSQPSIGELFPVDSVLDSHNSESSNSQPLPIVKSSPSSAVVIDALVRNGVFGTQNAPAGPLLQRSQVLSRLLKTLCCNANYINRANILAIVGNYHFNKLLKIEAEQLKNKQINIQFRKKLKNKQMTEKQLTELLEIKKSMKRYSEKSGLVLAVVDIYTQSLQIHYHEETKKRLDAFKIKYKKNIAPNQRFTRHLQSLEPKGESFEEILKNHIYELEALYSPSSNNINQELFSLFKYVREKIIGNKLFKGDQLTFILKQLNAVINHVKPLEPPPHPIMNSF